MKKYIYVSFILMTIMLFGSCAESKLQEAVEEFNKKCPISMGVAGELTKVTLDDDNVVLFYTMDEDYLNIEQLKSNKELVKNNMINVFRNMDSELNDMIKLMVDADKGFVVKIRGKQSGNTVSITLNHDDVALINDDSSEDNADEILKGIVENGNLQCPMDIENGMTMEKMSVEGNYVMYDIKIDEDMYSIDALKSNISQAKQNLLNSNLFSDPMLAKMVEYCVKADKGIAYRYTGDQTDDVCVVHIEPSELPVSSPE